MFARLDEEIRQLRKETGIHCISGCGKCCTKPDIEASPLEFLPLAFEWFKNGVAYEILEKLEQETSPICTIYSPLSSDDGSRGSCQVYTHRGLICRLFGYAASRDKLGQLRLVTCKLIKEQQIEEYERAVAKLSRNEYVPVFTDYYKRLIQIDFRLANQFYPINEAIRKAIEEVLHYYAYRPFPVLKKVS